MLQTCACPDILSIVGWSDDLFVTLDYVHTILPQVHFNQILSSKCCLAWAYQRQVETAESQAGAVSLTNDTSFVAEKISKPGLFEIGRIGIF